MKSYYEKLAVKIKETRDSKSFWEIVNEIKGRKFITGNNIKLIEFKNYFKELLNPRLLAEPVQYAVPLYFDGDVTDQNKQGARV